MRKNTINSTIYGVLVYSDFKDVEFAGSRTWRSIRMLFCGLWIYVFNGYPNRCRLWWIIGFDWKGLVTAS